MEQLWQILAGFLTWENLIFVSGILLTFLVTTVFVGNAFLKEFHKFIYLIHDALQDSSPGGKTITKKEAEGIVKQLLICVWTAFRKRLGVFKFLVPRK
jgi:hypothetical protein